MSMNVQKMSIQGLKAGAAIAIVPATVTWFIACSRVILINVIANAILRVLTGNMVQIEIYGSLIQVPLLWKISKISGMVGGGIFVFSTVVFLANEAWLHFCPPKRKFSNSRICQAARVVSSPAGQVHGQGDDSVCRPQSLN